MTIMGLDGKQYKLNLNDLIPKESDKRTRSFGHISARELLREEFPTDRILEELYLPGSNGLYADFYLPYQKLMVEVHGRQHFEFTKHFHGDRWGFLKSQKRDRQKEQWCGLNMIYLIVLKDSEIDEWRKQISSYND